MPNKPKTKGHMIIVFVIVAVVLSTSIIMAANYSRPEMQMNTRIEYINDFAKTTYTKLYIYPTIGESSDWNFELIGQSRLYESSYDVEIFNEFVLREGDLIYFSIFEESLVAIEMDVTVGKVFVGEDGAYSISYCSLEIATLYITWSVI